MAKGINVNNKKLLSVNQKEKAFQREVGAWDDLDIKRTCQRKSRSFWKAKQIPCTGIHYRKDIRLTSCFIGEESKELFPTET